MQEDEYVMPEMTHHATMIPARYTEVLNNLMYYPDTMEAITTAMSDYPLYETDPDAVRQYGTAYAVPSRDELNTKILNHYRFCEIGQETVGRWLFELKTALNEIMPYYNQLFYSADQECRIRLVPVQRLLSKLGLCRQIATTPKLAIWKIGR